MSDLLAVEAVLALYGWGQNHPLGGIEEWDALYADFPSRQSKLPVRDRSVIVCSKDETSCVEPPALQVQGRVTSTHTCMDVFVSSRVGITRCVVLYLHLRFSLFASHCSFSLPSLI
jgi:hypothetical protein